MVGDREACRILMALVEGFDEPHFATGAWFGGSTTRIRALLAAALGDQDGAGHLFEGAEAASEEAQSPPWMARTRVEWAEHRLVLGDHARAQELAAAALDAIGELELTVTRRRAEAILTGRDEPG